jgi:hypothetical protein
MMTPIAESLNRKLTELERLAELRDLLIAADSELSAIAAHRTPDKKACGELSRRLRACLHQLNLVPK